MFKKSIYGDKVLGYLMNANDSIDINNMKDWDEPKITKTSFLNKSLVNTLFYFSNSFDILLAIIISILK